MTNDDGIVVRSLLEDLERALRLGDETVVPSLLGVLGYYLDSREYNTLVVRPFQSKIDILLGTRTIEGSIQVDEIIENVDGSADIAFLMDNKSKEVMIGEGVNFVLIKGILKCDTSTMLRWAEAGKKLEMNT